MNRDKVKEALKQVLEQDDSLKYALATNLAKYGRPQSKKSDKPSKLTKGLEKGREKYVKDLKKSMDENKGRDKARDFISKMREAMRSFSNDELDTFRKDIAQALDLNVNEGLNEDKADATRWFSNLKYFYQKAFRELKGEDRETYKQLAKDFFSKLEIDDKVRPVGLGEGWNDNEVKVNLSDLSWDIVTNIFPDIKPGMGGVGFPLPSDASRMVGSKGDLESWKEDIMKRYGDVEVKIDSTASSPWDKVKILDDKFTSDKEQYIGGKAAFLDKERAAGRTTGLDEEMDPKEMKTGTYAGKKVVIHMHGPETEWKVEFIDTGKIVDYVDLMANLKFDDGTTYMDYLKEKKDKADRCLRVARRKMPQSSAYRSGLIVKCRKGMIWKKEK